MEKVSCPNRSAIISESASVHSPEEEDALRSKYWPRPNRGSNCYSFCSRRKPHNEELARPDQQRRERSPSLRLHWPPASHRADRRLLYGMVGHETFGRN